MPVHPFTIESGEERLAAVLHLPETTPAPCVVASHGLFSSKDSPKFVLIAEHFCARGVATIRYDHRGCGESSGDVARTTVASRLADLGAVLQFAHDRTEICGRIGLMGSSMGGFIALLKAAEEPDPPPLAVWSTPLFINQPRRDDPPGGLELPEEFMADARGYDLRDRASGVARCLVVHGASDEVVPLHHALTLKELLAPPKDLLILKGGDHKLSDLGDRQRAVAASCEWFKRHL